MECTDPSASSTCAMDNGAAAALPANSTARTQDQRLECLFMVGLLKPADGVGAPIVGVCCQIARLAAGALAILAHHAVTELENTLRRLPDACVRCRKRERSRPGRAGR